MINFFRRCIGYPPFKFKIGDIVEFTYEEYDYSQRPPKITQTKEILAKIHSRSSHKSYKKVNIGSGFYIYEEIRINRYYLGFKEERPSNVGTVKDEDELTLAERFKTKIGDLL